MKKRATVFMLLTLSPFVPEIHAQTPTVTSIQNNLDELFINKDNPYGEIPEKTVDNYLNETSKIYFCEIVYNNSVIYREGIKKTIPQSRDSETMANQFRFKYNKIYLDASLINESDKLRLLEYYTNKIIDISGKKMLALNDFEIIIMDYKKSKYVVNNPLDNMIINIYKAEFK